LDEICLQGLFFYASPGCVHGNIRRAPFVIHARHSLFVETPLSGREGFFSPTLVSPPRDGQQQGTLLQRFDVVQNAAVQHHQMASRDVHFSIGQVYADLSLQLLNGDPSLGSVLAHASAAFHQNKNDSEIWILRQRFGTPPAFSLPGLFSPELLQLAIQVDLQKRLRQPRQSLQRFNTFAGLASAEISSHDQSFSASVGLRCKRPRSSERTAHILKFRRADKIMIEDWLLQNWSTLNSR
jgi:hypothetical protein